MARTALLISLWLGAGILLSCGSSPTSRKLTMAEMQALNPGVTAAWLQQEYPNGAVTQRWPNGQVRQMRFRVTDPQGRNQTMWAEFDQRGVMVSKRYSGRIVRPPRNVK